MKNLPMNKQTIYALGFFDGVHLGHQALLWQAKALAEEKGCQAGVLTFTTHPDGLVSGAAPKLINTTGDRANLLRAFGMETVIEIPFDDRLKKTHWSDFLAALVNDGAAGFVCGSDFRFGSGGLGTAKKLAAFCEKRELAYAVVPQQLLDDIRVSSTHIRSLLENGDLREANRFLGHPHILTGEVIHGKELGRTIGIPTANLALPEEICRLPFGVYACKAQVEQRIYMAVTNIGSRPTVGGHRVTVEVLNGTCADSSVTYIPRWW